MDIESLTRHYGYPALFVTTMLQGEAILLVCGFLAHQGYLSLWIVWLVAALSATFGDVTYFEIGRHFGERALAKLPKRLTRMAKSLRRVIGRHPNEIMLSMRFLFGTRILLPLLCGIAPISTPRFMLLNAITALIWSAVFVGIGYLFGVAAQSFFHDLERVELLLVAAIIIFAIAFHWISGQIRHRRHPEED